MELEGKVALVTGGGRGIGRSICLCLGQAGADVAVNYLRDEGAAWEVASQIEALGKKAIVVQGDVSKGDEVSAMFSRVEKEMGEVDILVNNAGIVTMSMVEDMKEEEWRRVIDVNLTGVFLCCKAALGPMKRKMFGRIINIASTAAKRISYGGGAHYTASKAGVIAFTKHLAYELAAYGVTVNALCLGTTLTSAIMEKTTPQQREERVKLIPLGRFLTPEEHAGVIVFLASSVAAGITGQAIDSDGGSLLGWMDFRSYLALYGKA